MASSEAKEVTQPVKRSDQRQLQKDEMKIDRKIKKQDHNDRKSQKRKQRAEKKLNRMPVRRVFPIWLRVIVVLVLALVGLFGGMMVGYGVIGDGNPIEALDLDTWRHIIDIVIAE
ncbi:DNA-directed RNA polymerase subunit beta [Aquibacillus koreensis]|uniref:DNA-directed RNA polymerase subunit beta n=1 Tax=Aquibacillus koreensis TaxID=279446 RepID=A0A9X4AH49_9BACI|nr:DNA-directed RNA polymerase subunit beta [Aquibacillus koreensis]MCT2535109.1 DNA-directed RNA polymerase subunit beta [Aquibacillus koreensis]MDC3419752.1 DNA-directed RNA polymerase subunit beta [Aquibacillus koreensis]